MDRALIEDKLESLRRCIQRVADQTPATPEELAADADLQDIVALNLTRAIQLCVDIATHLLVETETPVPRTMGESLEGLIQTGVLGVQLAQRLKRAVGFRNVVVRDYQSIDWQIVHRICTEDLADFKAFARAVTEHLDRSGEQFTI